MSIKCINIFDKHYYGQWDFLDTIMMTCLLTWMTCKYLRKTLNCGYWKIIFCVQWTRMFWSMMILYNKELTFDYEINLEMLEVFSGTWTAHIFDGNHLATILKIVWALEVNFWFAVCTGILLKLTKPPELLMLTHYWKFCLAWAVFGSKFCFNTNLWLQYHPTTASQEQQPHKFSN